MSNLTITDLHAIRGQLRALAVQPDEHGNYHFTGVHPQEGHKIMSHEFPRRRDVRDMAEEMLHVLLSQHDEDEGFDRYFLTMVRDLMREGVPFEDAVGAFAPEPDYTDEDVYAAYAAYEDEPYSFFHGV